MFKGIYVKRPYLVQKIDVCEQNIIVRTFQNMSLINSDKKNVRDNSNNLIAWSMEAAIHCTVQPMLNHLDLGK